MLFLGFFGKNWKTGKGTFKEVLLDDVHRISVCDGTLDINKGGSCLTLSLKLFSTWCLLLG